MKILIAVSSPEESVSAHFANSLAQTIKVTSSQDIDFFPLFFRDGSEHMVLNMGITIACNEEFDGVVFIGREVSWRPEALIDLCLTNKDACAIPLFDGSVFSLNIGEIPRLEKDMATGEIKIQSASTEFFYLSRKAVEKLCNSHPSVVYGGNTIKCILQGAESFSNCFTAADLLAFRLKEAGFGLWANPNHSASKAIRVLHDPSFSEILKSLQNKE